MFASRRGSGMSRSGEWSYGGVVEGGGVPRESAARRRDRSSAGGEGIGAVTRRRVVAACSLIACLQLAAIAGAGDTASSDREDFEAVALSSPWRLELGGAFNTFDTSAAWSPKGLAGAVIVLEDTLGLEEQTSTFGLRISHRFNRRHSLQLSASDLRRTAARTIDADIAWGDYVFRAEGTVVSELTTRILRLKWSYDLSDSDRLSAGFSAGLSTFDLGLKLKGEARLEDETGEVWVDGVVEGADVIAPVPVAGFFLEYALTPKWSLHFDTEAIYLELGGQRGRVLLSEFTMEYSFNHRIGVVVGVSGTDLEYRGDEGDEKFGIDYRIGAATGRVVVYF